MNDERGLEVPDADSTAPEIREGRRGDPADTSLPPDPQDEFPSSPGGEPQ